MGLCSSKIPHKVLIIGLDESGKSTVLNIITSISNSNHAAHARGNSIFPTSSYTPTKSFQVKQTSYHRKHMRFFDLSGSEKTRDLWKYFVTDGTSAVIYVVDSANRARLQEAHDELHKLTMNHSFGTDIPLLILANKMDLPNHLTYAEIVDGLELGALKGRSWSLRLVSAVNGEGFEGVLDWIVENSSPL